WRHGLRPPAAATGRRKSRGMNQALDAGLQFNERAELRDPGDTAGAHLTHFEARPDSAPRIVEELFQTERDLVSRFIDAENFHRDLRADGRNGMCARDARPTHLGYVEQALDPSAQLDERAVVEHRCDAPGKYRARDDRFADRGRARTLFFFELLPP